MRLILVRHGESEGNAAGVLQGRLDYGLSERGAQQTRLTAERLASHGADRVLSSPLRRASTTAALIAEAMQLELALEEDLAEYDIGEGAGLTGPELREKFPELLEARARGERFLYPGEEGRDVFHARLESIALAMLAAGVVANLAGVMLLLTQGSRGAREMHQRPLTY